MTFVMPFEAPVLKEGWIPTNYCVDGRKVRVSLEAHPNHVFSLSWVSKEGAGTKNPFPILCIEVCEHKTRAKIISSNLAKSFLCKTTFGFVAMLKCEVGGELCESQMRLPPGTSLGKALGAARRWADAELTEEMGLQNGIFIKKNLV